MPETPAHSTSSAHQPAHLPAHLAALDGVRGIAILLVLAHQFGDLDPSLSLAAFLVEKGMYIGWMGVQLFFVLSGFLITGILLDTRGARNYWSGFMVRRALRIFPLYFLTLLVAFVVLPSLGIGDAKLEADRANQVWLWTYLVNWVTPHGQGSNVFPHFWSLAVEEQFYLLWPFLLWNATPRRAMGICGAFIIGALAIRGWMVHTGATREMFYYYSTTRMDALAMGGAAAALIRMPGTLEWLRQHARQLLWCALLIFVIGALPTRGWSTANVFGQIVGYGLVALIAALVILVAAATERAAPMVVTQVLRHSTLRATGKVSYAMYIFHKPMHQYLGKPLLAAAGVTLSSSIWVNLVYMLAATLVVYAVAWASWHLVEKHFIQLKRHFEPRGAPA